MGKKRKGVMMQKPRVDPPAYAALKLAIQLPHGIHAKDHKKQIQQLIHLYTAPLINSILTHQVQVIVLRQGEIAPADADAILQLPMRAFVEMMNK